MSWLPLIHSPQVLLQVARESDGYVILTERYCVPCKSGSLQISRALLGVQWGVLSDTDSLSRELRTQERFNKRASMVASTIKWEYSVLRAGLLLAGQLRADQRMKARLSSIRCSGFWNPTGFWAHLTYFPTFDCQLVPIQQYHLPLNTLLSEIQKSFI